jgi:hypothetical protein
MIDLNNDLLEVSETVQSMPEYQNPFERETIE